MKVSVTLWLDDHQMKKLVRYARLKDGGSTPGPRRVEAEAERLLVNSLDESVRLAERLQSALRAASTSSRQAIFADAESRN